MKNLKNYSLLGLLIFVLFSCQESEQVQPALSLDEKFELFSADVLNLPAGLSEYQRDAEILEIGKTYFDSIKLENKDSDNGNGRTAEEDPKGSGLVEVEGRLFGWIFTEDDCLVIIEYLPVGTPGLGFTVYSETCV